MQILSQTLNQSNSCPPPLKHLIHTLLVLQEEDERQGSSRQKDVAIKSSDGTLDFTSMIELDEEDPVVSVRAQYKRIQIKPSFTLQSVAHNLRLTFQVFE